MSATPLANCCHECQLFKRHPSPSQTITQVTEGVVQDRPYRVLIVMKAPTISEGYSGRLFDDEQNGWVMDYLNNQTSFDWIATTVLLCPGPVDARGYAEKIKPALFQNCSSHFLMPLVEKYQPHAILALGGEALAACWPGTRGACPSITKARLAPIRIEELTSQPWLLTTYDPRQHGWFLESNGRKGQDLTEEYIRVFSLLTETLSGGYTITHPDWVLINDASDLEKLALHCETYNVAELILDTENATWIGKKIRPWKDDPDGVAPLRLSPWHEDNELICIGISLWRSGKWETYVINCDPADGPDRDRWLSWLRVLLYGSNRNIVAWNNISDFQDLFIFLGLETFPRCDDGFLLRGLRDSSLTDNSLKLTAGELLVVPIWDGELDQALDHAKSVRHAQTYDAVVPHNISPTQIQKKRHPSLSCMLDIPREITYDYNAHDTLYTGMLIRDHLSREKLGTDFPWIAYNELIDGLPWLMEMERNGIPVDEAMFNQTLDGLEAEEEALFLELRAYPEVQRAEAQSVAERLTSGKRGKDAEQVFNIRSSIFYKHLILDMYGEVDHAGVVQVPDWFPRSAGGGLSSDQETINDLSGNNPKAFVPVENKAHRQLFWHKVQTWRTLGDDFTKLMGLLDHVVDGVIHARCRILRTDMSDDGEEGGGTVSGRFSFSPNIGNLKKTKRFLRNFGAPPGWKILRFDFGRAELAWLAWNSQDPLMLQWAMEGKDAHRERGAAMWAHTFKKPVEAFSEQSEAVQKEWRGFGKTQNFAEVYMEEPETTARKNNMDVEVVINNLRTSQLVHPKVHAMKKKIYDTCQHGGFVKSYLFERRRSAPRWNPSPQSAEEFLSLDDVHRNARNQANCDQYRSLWNTAAAQADSSDMTFSVGKGIFNRIKAGGWLDGGKVLPINFIHDSTDWLVREDYVELAKPALLQAHKDGLGKLQKPFPIPVPVDCQEAQTYADFLEEE